MSISMDGHEAVTDYSDFEFQQAQFEVFGNPDGSNSNTNLQAGIDLEVLEDKGGLDNNEVAELVYLKIVAGIEPEDENGSQGVSSSVELRGTFGINLPKSQAGQVGNGTEKLDNDSIYMMRGLTDTDNRVRHRAENRVLDHFEVRAGLPFDDPGANIAGNYSDTQYRWWINYRDVTGRGPVLDSNDDLTLNQALICSNSVIPVASQVKVSMIWDVAELDDAGRMFSVPE